MNFLNLFKNSPIGGRGAKQHDITDCGAACLASVAAHYQLRVPIARIRQYANTDKRGTNVLGMIEAANKLGFEAKGVKGSPESLKKIPLPAIAHVSLPPTSFAINPLSLTGAAGTVLKYKF